MATETDVDGKYPHWKDAITNENLVANIRCGLKYLLWHASYLLLAVLGTILLGTLKLLIGIGDRITPDTDGEPGRIRRGIGTAARVVSKPFRWLFGGIERVLTHPTTKRAGRLLASSMAIVSLIFIALFIVWLAIFHTYTFVGGIGLLLIVIGTVGLLDYLQDKNVGSKMARTPGVRRVYGNCPVHMDIEPKWFDSLMDTLNLDD